MLIYKNEHYYYALNLVLSNIDIKTNKSSIILNKYNSIKPDNYEGLDFYKKYVIYDNIAIGIPMNNLLLSAVIGDIAGSYYEHNVEKDYSKIDIFHNPSKFTDDTVCTFAIAEALLKQKSFEEVLFKRCNEHRTAGYGHSFSNWLINRQPYNSFGNGSAMRCSSIGWISDTKENCIKLAKESCYPTHSHPEGIKGAVATALTIFYLKSGFSKDDIKAKVLNVYYPQWNNITYNKLYSKYKFISTCQGTVPPAIICFLESSNYIDCIKKAIALGGDSDTLASIAGPMAYAYYKEMPQNLIDQAKLMLPDWILEVNKEFDSYYNL